MDNSQTTAPVTEEQKKMASFAARQDAEKLFHLLNLAEDHGDPELMTQAGKKIFNEFQRKTSQVCSRIRAQIYNQLIPR